MTRILLALSICPLAFACDDDGTVCYGLCITESADPEFPDVDELCVEDLDDEAACTARLQAMCSLGYIYGDDDGEPFFSTDCRSCDDGCVDYPAVAFKPNIYLYPEQPSRISVRLDMSPGAELIASVPEYGGGWSVEASPDGTIDGRYSYLFYETTVGDVFQRDEGWAVPVDEAMPWFEGALAAYGFSGPEIDDFVAAWEGELPEAGCYRVFPQLDAEISRTVGLRIDPAPESVLRAWFLVDCAEVCGELKAPEIPAFDRSGFSAVEWGVVLE